MATLYVSTTGLLCLMCGPGTYKTNDCIINMTSATCAECPTGTFQTTDNQAEYCATCLTSCVDRYQVVSAPCTKIANTQCRCKDGYYFKNLSADGSEGHCLQNKTKLLLSNDFWITKSNVSECGNKSILLCRLEKRLFNVTQDDGPEKYVLLVAPIVSLAASVVGFLLLIMYYAKAPNVMPKRKRLDVIGCTFERLHDDEWRSLILFIATQAVFFEYRIFLKLMFEISGLDDNVESIISTHESNHPFSRTEVVYETLQTWRQKLNRNASVDAVYSGLSRAGCRRKVIRRVRRKYKELVESRIRPPTLKRSHSYTAGLLGEAKGPIQGKSMVELSAYI